MKTIPVIYSPNMATDTKSFSPSSAKPRQAVDDWLMRSLPISVVAPYQATDEDLANAHCPEYIDAVLSGEAPNGFGNTDEAVAEALRYTTGAMIDAARFALGTGVACAPVSGFHHAGYDFGGGFCTFNGLMVTAVKLLQDKLAKRVAILDLDMHYGNGTANIIERLSLQDSVRQFSASYYPDEAELFLAELPATITKIADGADILLYQAGADSHIDDPLGGYLTTAQMRIRDRLVFGTCKELGLPVAWNLAGGYQRDGMGTIAPVLRLHRATMEECVKVYCS